jgi:hypothetical protein
MQHALASCQPDATRTRHVAPESAPATEHACGRRKRWTPDPAETITHTASRRSGRAAWLRALERAVTAGLVPGYNDTTQAIVDVLETRMGYDSGHARYVLADVMERTGLKRTAVTDHIKMLRAAGWLAWAEHGSLRNALRAAGMPGYAKTATVYAATIPPEYDAFEGNILRGRGYTARVVGVTPEARERRIVEASRTPSLRVVKEDGQVQVVGGKDGSTANAAADQSTRRKKKLTVTGYRITGERIDRARHLAVSVRPHVNWIQGASHDQLSWVFLDLVARDWSESRIVLWLRNLGAELGVRRWRPRFPHRVIAAAIRRDDQAAAQRAHTTGPGEEAYVPATAPNAAFQAARAAMRADGPQEPAETVPTVDEAPETAWDLATLREAADAEPGLIRSFARLAGRDAALRVYGTAAARILDTADAMARAGFLATA